MVAKLVSVAYEDSTNLILGVIAIFPYYNTII
jgi:hypothetical protein